MILEDIEWVDESDLGSFDEAFDDPNESYGESYGEDSDPYESDPYAYEANDFDPYESIRPALGEGWQRAEPEQIEAMLYEVTRSMTIEEAENFWSTLSNIGRTIAPIAAQVVPIAGQVVGGLVGGPAGSAIGGTLGRMAGQAIGSAGGVRPPAPPRAPIPAQISIPPVPSPIVAQAPVAPSLGQAAPGQVGQGQAAPGQVAQVATSATSQLLSFLQNPQLLQSVLGQLLGSAGRTAQPVGQAGATAPFGAFMNALSVLSNQAASEALGESSDASYLYDSHGHLLADPNSPEERAAVLLGHLRGSVAVH